MNTTNDSAKEKIHDDLVDNLQELLEKNYDAEKGFKKAMEDSKNPALKAYLQRQAAQRNRFATELTQELRNLNAKPNESGSVAGSLHRTWIDVKSALTGHSDESILEECIRGEKASVKEYDEKLKENTFPASIQSVLSKQANEVRNTLNRVKSLEDIADNQD